MPVMTRSPRRPRSLVAVALLAAVVLAGCSSSNGDAAPGDSTALPTSVPGTSVVTDDTTGTTDTTGPLPSSPSTIPASVDTACAALAQTYGLDALQPKNSGSWVDERQRIVVDAQREAQLLSAAQDGPPADVVTALGTMAAYARWLATTVGASASFSEAVSAVDGYPDARRCEPGGGDRQDVADGQLPGVSSARPTRVGPRPSPTGDGTVAHSWTSSIRVPRASFGWMNATVVPREPGRGCSSSTRKPWALTASSASPQSATR